MRKRSFRLAVTAAVFCVSAFLLACPLGQLRVLIPDYLTSGVKGVQLYRMDDASGQLVEAGHIEFVGIETSKRGEEMSYKQFTADGQPYFGPIFTPVIRNPAQPASIEVTLAFMNQLPAGWFKVASYNLIGTSGPSASQTFIIGEEG